MTAPLPVRDFTACADPLREMQLYYKGARERMLTPRVIPRIAPSIPEPNRELTVMASQEKRARLLEEGRAERLENLKILQIARIVAVVSGVPVADIKGPRRLGDIVKARQIAMYIACRTGRTIYSVAYYLGKRDHTAARNARKNLVGVARRLHLDRCHDAVEIAQRLWEADWAILEESAR